MAKKKRGWKRELTEWGVIIGIFLVLYATGLHTEVIGRMQQVLLWTGIMQPETTEPAASREQADYNFPLVTLDGQQASLRDFRGKTVFMNFWATWCPPCVAEMPNIHSLYKKTDPEKVAFVMVSMDDSREKARKFIQRKGFDFPVYLPAGPVPALYQSSTIPTTFVISPDGKIVSKREGMAEYDTRRFRDFLQRISGE